jgi:hypothetical protein
MFLTFGNIMAFNLYYSIFVNLVVFIPYSRTVGNIVLFILYSWQHLAVLWYSVSIINGLTAVNNIMNRNLQKLTYIIDCTQNVGEFLSILDKTQHYCGIHSVLLTTLNDNMMFIQYVIDLTWRYFGVGGYILDNPRPYYGTPHMYVCIYSDINFQPVLLICLTASTFKGPPSQKNKKLVGFKFVNYSIKQWR